MLHRREVLQAKRLPSIHPTARLFKSLIPQSGGRCLALSSGRSQAGLELTEKLIIGYSPVQIPDGVSPSLLLCSLGSRKCAGEGSRSRILVLGGST